MIAAPLIAFLLKHEALVGWAAVLAGAVLFGAVTAHRLEAPALAKTRAAAAQAQAQAATQAASARLAVAASAVVETARTREVAATQTAQETTDALARAPEADQPVPPGILSGWAVGVDRLRDQAAAARALAADPGGAGAARPMPPA